jgi:hypothetical protein
LHRSAADEVPCAGASCKAQRRSDRIAWRSLSWSEAPTQLLKTQQGASNGAGDGATIRDGKVVDVRILSSTPRGLFDAAVKSAMSPYGCDTTGATEIVAVQNFEFRAAQ